MKKRDRVDALNSVSAHLLLSRNDFSCLRVKRRLEVKAAVTTKAVWHAHSYLPTLRHNSLIFMSIVGALYIETKHSKNKKQLLAKNRDCPH